MLDKNIETGVVTYQYTGVDLYNSDEIFDSQKYNPLSFKKELRIFILLSFLTLLADFRIFIESFIIFGIIFFLYTYLKFFNSRKLKLNLKNVDYISDFDKNISYNLYRFVLTNDLYILNSISFLSVFLLFKTILFYNKNVQRF
ncbi:hypothetical protein UF10_07165 [Peptostreptococcus russellii]|uniref:Uncharacterized protein n=1 Tax=Peptostreptococcus russellii TaxID=215200 RepID=A0A2P7PZ98_9FIRM|nr:hypothetical protein [Peptostreptococcus russellii]PSJ31049.1 hypothetical protein UF10_07165 [Peptostreptococcus russellii]